MKKRIALLLCAVMTAMLLVGCGGSSEKDKLLGTWEGEIDMAPIMNDVFAEMEDMAEYFVLDKLTSKVTLVFSEDDMCHLQVDEASLTAAMEELGDWAVDRTNAYLADFIKAQGLDMTVEEVLALSGVSIEDMRDSMLEEINPSQMAKDMESKGAFAVKDGKLYMAGDDKTDPMDTLPFTYTLEGDTLLLEATEEMAAEDELTALLFPLQLKKVG